MTRLFSGIQPTGVPHLGNYLGTLVDWPRLAREHEAFFCLVDLHALTRLGAREQRWDPLALARRRLECVACLLAIGVDPTRATLFVQSSVPAHAELAWVLGCLAPLGELGRMTAFKQAAAERRGRDGGVDLGLLAYPVLQAADILCYRAEVVPVGEDQRQHLELVRTLARRADAILGGDPPLFVEPRALLAGEGARIMALDDPARKMSKSTAHPAGVIALVDPDDAIRHKLTRAVTDAGREVRPEALGPGVRNLLRILARLERTSEATLAERYAGRGYAELKRDLADRLVAALAPIRERYLRIVEDPAEIERLLEQGAKRARAVAGVTLSEVYARAGLTPPHGVR